MKLFVTGVAGQLGHDVMNELNKRGYEGVGSDLAPEYSGIQDGTAVTTMPYVSVDITDASAVEKAITEAGVGVGFYKDYEEAVSMTVKETRRHEPNPENKEVYNKTYRTYRDLYESLKDMMVRQ